MGVRFKDGSWEASVMIKGVRRSKRFSSKKMAAHWVADQKLKSERREMGFPVKVDLEEFLDEFLPYFKDHASRNGYERMLLSVRHLREYTKIGRLDLIDHHALEGFKRARKTSVCENTVNRELSDIRSMFSYAVKKNYLIENPFKKVDLYRIKTKKLPRWLTDPEIKRLLSVATGTMWPVIVIAINTGLRKKELTMLEWNDIDFEEKLLYVRNKPEYGYHTKNYEPRALPINGDAYRAFLIQKNMVRGMSEYVFPNSFGNPRRNNLNRDLEVCYRRAGIKGANVHSLRHTFCTQLARRNVPVQKIMKLAGHKDIATTMIYVNLVKEDLRDSVEKLDFGLGSQYNKCGKITAEAVPALTVLPQVVEI